MAGRATPLRKAPGPAGPRERRGGPPPRRRHLLRTERPETASPTITSIHLLHLRRPACRRCSTSPLCWWWSSSASAHAPTRARSPRASSTATDRDLSGSCGRAHGSVRSTNSFSLASLSFPLPSKELATDGQCMYAVPGERLSPYVSLACVIMALYKLIH